MRQPSSKAVVLVEKNRVLHHLLTAHYILFYLWSLSWNGSSTLRDRGVTHSCLTLSTGAFKGYLCMKDGSDKPNHLKLLFSIFIQYSIVRLTRIMKCFKFYTKIQRYYGIEYDSLSWIFKYFSARWSIQCLHWKSIISRLVTRKRYFFEYFLRYRQKSC